MDDKKCKQCSKEFGRGQQSLSRFSRARFCSVSCASRARWASPEYRKKLSDKHKGHTRTKGMKFNLSNKERARRAEHCRNLPKPKNTHTLKWREAMRNLRGENNVRWKGGVSSYHHKVRGRVEWREWRHHVFERDDYRCIDCGRRGVQLEPHHILPLATQEGKERVYDVDNGITLCRKCHMKTFGKETEFASTYAMFTGITN